MRQPFTIGRKKRRIRSIRIAKVKKFGRGKPQLKKLVADLRLDKQILQDVLKNLPAGRKVLRPANRRELVGKIRMKYDISINRCCALVLLSKSVYYYKSIGCDDELVCMRMKEIASTRVRYGFWRIYILLRREGF
ncbi:transposase [Zunongwangia atlantica 22II14-10F7]|uniref:Transposase n=1 Tax=Zunongwangia atlantica 22II14-10F7 TaxID=1185767 RepID=A0A1Y1T176_9FLAO|nr:transposase [Zunongwangia atlantica 22II14-10F7]